MAEQHYFAFGQEHKPVHALAMHFLRKNLRTELKQLHQIFHCVMKKQLASFGTSSLLHQEELPSNLLVSRLTLAAQDLPTHIR